MTGIAIVRNTAAVPAIGVALLAAHTNMRSGQLERGCGVTEGGRLPLSRGVTLGAIMRQQARHVAGALRGGEVRSVTRVTVGSEAAAVLTGGMTLLTIHGRVRARQGEGGRRVTEGGRLPNRSRVALQTIVRQ
jgi:hypothetical protein